MRRRWGSAKTSKTRATATVYRGRYIAVKACSGSLPRPPVNAGDSYNPVRIFPSNATFALVASVTTSPEEAGNPEPAASAGGAGSGGR